MEERGGRGPMATQREVFLSHCLSLSCLLRGGGDWREGSGGPRLDRPLDGRTTEAAAGREGRRRDEPALSVLIPPSHRPTNQKTGKLKQGNGGKNEFCFSR